MKILNKFFTVIALMSLLLVGGVIEAKKHSSKNKVFKHNIQLQLSDSLGFPVPGTEFWVTIDVIKDGPLVTLQLPTINFQTGQTAGAELENFPPPFIIPGGYLYTAAGFLPECFRPNDLVPRSIVAASNNGLSPVFSFTQDPATLPNPIPGYIVQVRNDGSINVQAAGIFGNIIPEGPQVLLPCSISYIAKKDKRLCKNVMISTGFSDITQATEPAPQSNGYRDTHVNDAFDGVVAFTWADNSQRTPFAVEHGWLDAMVAVGKVVKGKLVMNPPINLSNFPDHVSTWDTAVTINRTNPDNIIVSYLRLEYIHVTGTYHMYRAVSFDGGKTWPYNGLLVPGQPHRIGDYRGVACDKYGNIWTSNTDGSANTNPQFYVSTDGGITFNFVYQASPVPDVNCDGNDFPQYCFGTDQNGQYGMWFTGNVADFCTGDGFPSLGFIPINGLGDIDVGNAVYEYLPGLTNRFQFTDIASSTSEPFGRVFLKGWTAVGVSGSPYPDPFTYVQNRVSGFKSPGNVDENIAGPWHNFTLNQVNANYFGATFFSEPLEHISNIISYPWIGTVSTVHTYVYDEKRKALYNVQGGQSPDYSQNCKSFLMISRDNGQTWPVQVEIATTDFANRGWETMALDEVTGDLVFGWYDGRNDKAYHKLEYFGAVISAKKLDALVNSIPLSDPLYVVPSLAA